MTQTYAEFSDVCTKFYDLIIKPTEIADFVYSKIEQFSPKTALFVGGFFLVARELQQKGLDLTVVDYTEEMVAEGKKRLPDIPVQQADLLELPYSSQFEAVLTPGRVFTHMLTEQDANRAVESIARVLKPGGVVFIDNYEDSRIQATDYFNGLVEVSDASVTIARKSSTTLVSNRPFVVNWEAEYRVMTNGNETVYSDQMLHRAFSREEMRSLLKEKGFTVISQGDNFDETSFFTIASYDG